MIRTIIRILSVILVFSGVFWLVVNTPPKQQSNDYFPQRLKASFAYQAAKWYNDRRAFPANRIPPKWKEDALKHISANNTSFQKQTGVAQLSWQAIGPSNIGGRIRSILIDPQRPETMYVGSVSGGIWKTTNGGLGWFPTSDEADNLCIGTMVMDPTNPNIIYAGTGEGYFNIDALRGAGVLKTTNGGASWTLLTNFQTPSSSFSYYYINKLVIRPDNPNILYAAMLGGIWKTTDAGASWSKLTVGNSSAFCMDLVANPSNPDVMYASFGLFMPTNDGIYKTTNGGTSWTKLTGGFPSQSTGYCRISLAISKSNPNILFASLSDSNFYTHSILRTTNAGTSWSLVTTPTDNSISGSNRSHLGGQGFYNNVIAVHPTDSSRVYAGGINIFRSVNSGTSWTRLVDGNGAPNFHVDQHAIVFHPNNPLKMYFGNDGGIYRTTDGGTTFTNLNTNLSITQFYSGAVHPTQNIFYGGTQDNGTLMSTNQPLWYQILGGDGGPVLVDRQDPDNVFMSYVYLTIYKSTSGGGSAQHTMNGIPTVSYFPYWASDRCAFIAPLTMDPNNSQIIYAGTYRVFKTTNGGATWSAISSDITGSGPGSVQTDGAIITTISAANSNASVLYVGTSGWTGVHSRVSITTNGGGAWSHVTSLPNRDVTSIAIDPLNANRAIVAFSGYNSNTAGTPGHVFLTTNRGSTWTNVSGDLPDIPVTKLLIDPKQLNHFIAGTDLGVFESTNGGTNWVQENSGLANVAIADLDIRNDGYILAATHGRGMFLSTSDLFSGLLLYYPENSAINIAQSVTLRWKKSDSSSVYRLKVSTDPNFTSSFIINDTTLTETTKTISGLAQNQTYYWQIGIRKNSGMISSSAIWSFTTVDLASYPDSITASGSVAFPNFSDKGSYNSSHYRLIGLPGNSDLLLSSILPGVHNTDWQAYWDNGSASDYLIEYDGSNEFRLQPGRAFWVLNKGNLIFTKRVPTLPLNVGGALRIPLHSGWNLITNPYTTSITWGTIKAANSISEPLWAFGGSFSSAGELEPYQGYYFFNATNLDSLTIPIANTQGKKADILPDWSVSIRLESGEFIEENTVIGVSSLALNGLDRMDARKPRATGTIPSVTMNRPEWDSQYISFATDVRHEIGDLQRWKCTVTTDAQSSGTLSWKGIADIPSGYGVYLIDAERGKALNLREKNSYTFASSSAERDFEVVVGTESALETLLAGIAPRTFALSSNYPNPFNPSTTFEFRLPRAVHVSFKIYSITGEEVATLADKIMESGEHSIQWNANGFASGVYLARMKAGEFTSVKKILLVK